MPILEIEVVLRPAETLPPGLAAELADRAGQVFGSAAGHTWVKLRSLPPGSYAENGTGTPTTVHPVFVSVLKANLPAGEQMAEQVARLAQEVGRACDRPAENVHILYLPSAAGRIAFGGRLPDV